MTYNPAIEILLTRPAAQSAAYAKELQALLKNKVRILKSPLMRIETLQTDLDLTDVHHLLFTSSNGVRAFAGLSDSRDIPALCVGDRTADAARAFGLNAISAQGSVAELAKLAINLGQDLSGCFLHLRGKHVAGNIGEDLALSDLAIREAVIYNQRALPLADDARAALTGIGKVILPLFSPRTAKLLMQQVGGRGLSNVTAICISQNVADQLDPSEFTHVLVAEHADAKAVTKVITREIAASV
jgi:uroporphyrinogen-III synthase